MKAMPVHQLSLLSLMGKSLKSTIWGYVFILLAIIAFCASHGMQQGLAKTAALYTKEASQLSTFHKGLGFIGPNQLLGELTHPLSLSAYELNEFNKKTDQYQQILGSEQNKNNMVASIGQSSITGLKGLLSKASKIFTLSLELFFYKLVVLLFALPLFAIVMAAGLIDGLCLRAVRKAEVGRESTFVFHKILKLGVGLFFLLWFLYLAVPTVLTPAVFIVPMACVVLLASSLTMAKFKKYL